MVIVYHGNVEQLKKELQEKSDVLNQRYVEILGQERVRRLRETANRILGPQSFFDNVHALNSYLGENLTLDTSNKMFIATSSHLEIKANGDVRDKKVRTAPIFYISEEGFRHSESAQFTETHLASFVHEYDHFVWYALQKTPIYIINLFLVNNLNSRTNPVNLSDYFAQLTEENIPAEEKIKRSMLALYSSVITEAYEKSNRVLDNLILNSIGIEVPLLWRGKEREYDFIPLPTGQVIQLAVGGDPFRTLEDKDIVERVINWEKYYTSMMRVPYIQNLEKSIRNNVNVSRVPIQELKENIVGGKRDKRRK